MAGVIAGDGHLQPTKAGLGIALYIAGHQQDRPLLAYIQRTLQAGAIYPQTGQGVVGSVAALR